MNRSPRGRFSLTWIILAIVVIQGVVGAFLGSSSNTVPFIVAIVVVLGLVAAGIVVARRGQQNSDDGMRAKFPHAEEGSSSGSGAGRSSTQKGAIRGANLGNMSTISIAVGLFMLGGMIFLLVSFAGEGGSSVLLYIIGGVMAVVIGVGAALWNTRKN